MPPAIGVFPQDTDAPNGVAEKRSVRGIMRRLTMCILVLAILAGLTGCATFRGMGEDIENLGKAMKKSTT
jgi:predicted small secreted protein